MILLSSRDGISHAWGSGVIVNKNIALTARHVIDEFLDYYEGPAGDTLDEVSFNLQAIQFIDNGKKAWAWNITRWWRHEKDDIAFLYLQPTTDEQLNYNMICPKLQILPPQIGDRVSAFGYHSSVVTVDGKHITVRTNPYTSSGFVTKVYHAQRDSCMMPWPCYETNARFDGGMSGGPVFNAAGYLCGIVASCLPPDPDKPDDHYTSFVNCLWPAMSTSVSMNRPGDFPQDVFYLAIELAIGGFITVVDIDLIKVTQIGDNLVTEFPNCALQSSPE